MSDETRGKALQERRVALGIKSQHKLASTAKEMGWELSRDAIMAAEGGKASAATYQLYEALLDRLEALRAGASDEDFEDDAEGGGGTVEIRASGDFNVDIVVKGPVRDADVLRRIASDLIREARSGDKK